MIKFFTLLSLCVHLANCFYISDDSDEVVKEKIVGGLLIDIRLAPYQVQIEADRVPICGGSIISKQWILTAAHCFEEIRSKRFSVTSGASHQGEGLQHAIAQVHIHSNYDEETIDNDIALIKLKRPMKFDNRRKAIAISNEVPKTGDKLKISGFGKIGDRLDYSDDLKAAMVNVLDQAECRSLYDGESDITENMFCAAKEDTDSCQGDSGGPAVINGRLSGIISFGKECASSYYPGVYTRVYNYRDWIVEKTGLRI